MTFTRPHHPLPTFSFYLETRTQGVIPVSGTKTQSFHEELMQYLTLNIQTTTKLVNLGLFTKMRDMKILHGLITSSYALYQ